MWILKFLILAAATQNGLSLCYFPVEYQGIFTTQSAITDVGLHKYSTVTILPDAIPVWGVCQQKMGHNVVLYDRTGGKDCMRCFNIILRSPNVVQIHTEVVDKCYANVEEAMASCPSTVDINSRRAKQIMLYKSRTFTTREGSIDRLFCPINGQYHFTYNVNDGTEDVFECPQSTSALANCPRSSELQIRFQRCTFGDVEMSLRCLGNWKGDDGQNYLALWDPSMEKHNKPRYRCAMYDIDEITGVVHLSFSADATCTNALHSPWEGFESMVLTPLLTKRPPAEVKDHACTFPDWAKGEWQNLEILQNDLILKDSKQDKIYQLECLSQHAPHGERYALFSRDQCGREEFTCIWIKKRDVNVIEFQMSKYPSDHYNLTQVCADDMFLGQHWKTEGRTSDHKIPSCPIQGEHTGTIPDAPDLCAKLVSDCNSPQRMLYTVSSCSNTSEIYEDREYNCLGRWQEGGVTYTYTHRVDVDTYECFAGVVVNNRELFIIEAGSNCQRGLQPLAHGMKLLQQASCLEKDSSSSHLPSIPPTTTTTKPPHWWRTSPKNPWLKKNTRPTRKPFWKDQKPHLNTSPQIHQKNFPLHSLSLLLLLLSSYYIRWL